MTIIEVIFWICAAGLVWTHVGYPTFIAAWAALTHPVTARDGATPSVVVIVAAHNEQAVIERRIANLRALDYPAERLEIVVTSDASTDATDALAEAAGVRVIGNPRGGKVAAQDRAVRETHSEIVAFSDANAMWQPGALRALVARFADPGVAYVCGQLQLEAAEGGNREGLYWRYEMGVRGAESKLGSITGGNGSIYALRRDDYVEVDPRFGHDLALPYLMVRHGRRAVYEASAIATEKPTPSNESEYRRKVRMFEHCWMIVLRGGMLRGLGPRYTLEIISHRFLRYGSGLLHILLLASTVALLTQGWIYVAALALQLALVAAALAGVPVARYYGLITLATVVGLVNYLRRGVPASWQAAEGTR